jgi:hypothetical protein
VLPKYKRTKKVKQNKTKTKSSSQVSVLSWNSPSQDYQGAPCCSV